MKKELIMDVSYNENRVAILEDEKLVEVYIERPRDVRVVGNIYRGKVDRVLPGMQSAFIDIGQVKNAFIHVSDIANACYEFDDEDTELDTNGSSSNVRIEDVLREGQEITVQVMKEAIGTKGSRITTHITLPGRSMVLLPCAEYTGISKRISDGTERDRLKTIAKKITQKSMGLIMRTAAENSSESQLSREYRYLKNEWIGIKKREKKGKVPRILYNEPDLLERTIRDVMIDEVERLVINDKTEFKKAVKFLKTHSPELTKRVEFFDDGYDIFEKFGIEVEINKALGRKVWLKNGAYLIIDKTEALTVIDVNTGKYTGKTNLEDTVSKVNMDAACEIAKQLRLRDIGGIIVIDFIDMMKELHRRNVTKALEEALKKDKTKTEVFGMSKLGLVEMTRKKVRQELATILKVTCDTCAGNGKIISRETMARSIEKQIAAYLAHATVKNVEITISADIYTIFVGENNENIERLEKEYKKKITLKSNTDFKPQEIKIVEMR